MPEPFSGKPIFSQNHKPRKKWTKRPIKPPKVIEVVKIVEKLVYLDCLPPSEPKPKRSHRIIPKEIRETKNKVKELSLKYKGGCCSKCGYAACPRALEFHHRDPKEKMFSISKYTYFDDTLKNELDKCDLLCSNCHRETHYFSASPASKTEGTV